MATGCMGMATDDFMRCTPSEFRAAHEAWTEREQRRERAAWERTRMSCLCSLQPWSKKTLEARDVMEFPWDRKPDTRNEAQDTREQKGESREEVLARYAEARKRAGLK